jgi:hypothetical protein
MHLFFLKVIQNLLKRVKGATQVQGFSGKKQPENP